jgi:hypothetical protein
MEKAPKSNLQASEKHQDRSSKEAGGSGHPLSYFFYWRISENIVSVLTPPRGGSGREARGCVSQSGFWAGF